MDIQKGHRQSPLIPADKPLSGAVPQYRTSSLQQPKRPCSIGARPHGECRLNPLERARTEPKLASGFLIRSASKSGRVVYLVGPQRPKGLFFAEAGRRRPLLRPARTPPATRAEATGLRRRYCTRSADPPAWRRSLRSCRTKRTRQREYPMLVRSKPTNQRPADRAARACDQNSHCASP